MTTDRLLTERDEEELLSIAYVHAVATRAGYVTATYEKDLDGIDLRIQAGGEERPALELQLKATTNLAGADDEWVRFPVPRRNYDLLRIETLTPRLLVVFDLPKDRERWMTVTEDELIIRHRAYWMNLCGQDETDNTASVTVWIPKRNRLNIDSLRALMEQSRNGKIL